VDGRVGFFDAARVQVVGKRQASERERLNADSLRFFKPPIRRLPRNRPTLQSLDIDAAVCACARARRWVEHGVGPLSDESIRQPPNISTFRYLSAHCRWLWQELGTLDDIERVAEEIREGGPDDLPSIEAMLYTDLKPFKPERY